MNGTVAPSSSSAMAERACSGLAPISSAMVRAIWFANVAAAVRGCDGEDSFISGVPVDAAAGAVGKEAIVASPTGRGNPLTAPLSRLRYPDRAMRPCPSGHAWTSRPPGPSARGRLGGLLLDERALEHVLPGHADPRGGDKTAPIEQRAEVGQHLRAAADHR